MRVFKSISIRPETLRTLEDIFGDVDTINFSALADTAIERYLENMKTRSS